jgi:hypothetical protein
MATRDTTGRRIADTERTLDNISNLLYEANKPAETFKMKMVHIAASGEKMGVLMRFLSGSGAWRFLNKVRAVAVMARGYAEGIDEANKALRDSAKEYAEQVKHMSELRDIFDSHGNLLDRNLILQSHLGIALTEQYGEAFALQKIHEMSVEALGEQADKMDEIKRANMVNKDMLVAMSGLQSADALGMEEAETLAFMQEEAVRRGLGKMDDAGNFVEHPKFKQFFTKRFAGMKNAMIAVGDFIGKIAKSAWEFIKNGAKLIGMGLLYIGLFLLLLVLLKPFIVRVWDSLSEMKKQGSGFIRILGETWANLKERFGVVWEATSGFFKILFDKEASFKDTFVAFVKMIGSIVVLILGTAWDLFTLILAGIIELGMALLRGAVKLLGDAINLGKDILISVAYGLWDVAQIQFWKMVAWLGNFMKGKSVKALVGGALGGGIGFMLGGPAGAVLGASAGAVIGGSMATGGLAGASGSFLVGERGPEIVNLPRGARVTPNHQLRGMGGNTIHVHVSGRVGASDQEIRDIARKVGAQVSREINRTTSSGMRA